MADARLRPHGGTARCLVEVVVARLAGRPPQRPAGIPRRRWRRAMARHRRHMEALAARLARYPALPEGFVRNAVAWGRWS